MGSITEQKTIDIAIVGGGIGGLALAIGLQQYSHIRIKIYEAASKFSEIGGESFSTTTSRDICIELLYATFIRESC